MVASCSLPVEGSTILASGGMITATGSTAQLAISDGVPSTGVVVKSASVTCLVPEAGVGSTADTTFSCLDANYTVPHDGCAGYGGDRESRGLQLGPLAGFTIGATNTAATL
jgi:hypothetical protein